MPSDCQDRSSLKKWSSLSSPPSSFFSLTLFLDLLELLYSLRHVLTSLIFPKSLLVSIIFTVRANSYDVSTYDAAQPTVIQREAWKESRSGSSQRKMELALRFPKHLQPFYGCPAPSGIQYCVLYETTLSSNCTASRCPYSKGWGLFIVPVRQSHIFRDLHFSAPHPTVRHGHSSTSCSSIPALPCEEPPCCRTSSTCLQQTIDLRSITSAFALLHNRSSARYRMRQLIVTLTDFDLSFVPDGAVFSTRVLSYAIGQTWELMACPSSKKCAFVPVSREKQNNLPKWYSFHVFEIRYAILSLYRYHDTWIFLLDR